MDQFHPAGKIKDLLIQGVVSSDTRLVLVNAIYFKGKWMKQFSENATRDQPFKLNQVTVCSSAQPLDADNDPQYSLQLLALVICRASFSFTF